MGRVEGQGQPAEMLQQSNFPAGFQWHWKAHLEWAGETLVFIFFKFHPTYDRAAAVEGIQALMSHLGILSYAFYELSAPHDVLIRAWLPMEHRAARLPRELEKSWPNAEMPEMSVVLEVEKIWHHWPWQSNELAKIGEMSKPPVELLESGCPARELDTLNNIQRAANLASSSFSGVEGPMLVGEADAQKLVSDYKKQKLITEPPYYPGVRFLILVEAKNANQKGARDRLGRKLAKLLDEAQNGNHSARPRIWDRSLYSTAGEYPFIILGRVDEAPGNFHSIGDGLVAAINERLATAGARTHTSYFLQPGFLDFRDELRVRSRPLPKAPDATDLLARHESATLEVKGSAFAELSPYLEGKEEEPTGVVGIDNKPLASLLRAVVSMLNAGEDGHIVIGAIEPDRYSRSEIVRELPQVGNFKACGIDLDLSGRDWDRYTLRLQKVMESRIQPDPMRWIRLTPSPLPGNRIACVISISLPDEWFEGEFRSKGGTIEHHFIVRGGGAGALTKRLKSSVEIQEHKRHTRRAARRRREEE